MFKKQFNYITMFATGLFFCTLGVSFFIDSLEVWNWIYSMFVIGVSCVGVLKLFNLILNFTIMQHVITQILDILFWVIAIILSLTIPDAFFMLFPRLISGWILLHALIKIIVLYIKVNDHLPIPIYSIIFLIGDLIISFNLLVNLTKHEFILSCFLGGYFIIYGGNALLDCIRELTPNGSGEQLDKKIRLSVPTFMSVIIPQHLMSSLLNKDREERIKEQFEAIKKDIPIDMEILIHLAPSGPAMLGHADVIYRGFIISYGCYDPHNRHLFGTMGDGVVIIAPKDSYIKNCLENENKVLISFGVSLNAEQKKRLNARLLEVFSSFIDFESDEQLVRAGKLCQGNCDDYISRVTRTSPTARFYKVKSGKLKTFFVVSSNCAYFLVNLLSVIGLNVFDLSGIISPGAYYDFLNKQFKSDKGFVVSRKLYRKKDAYLFDRKDD